MQPNNIHNNKNKYSDNKSTQLQLPRKALRRQGRQAGEQAVGSQSVLTRKTTTLTAKNNCTSTPLAKLGYANRRPKQRQPAIAVRNKTSQIACLDWQRTLVCNIYKSIYVYCTILYYLSFLVEGPRFKLQKQLCSIKDFVKVGGSVYPIVLLI